MKLRILTFLSALILASSLHAETPQEAAGEILKLLKDKQYPDLFTTRYTEWSKVEKQGIPVEEAIAKLSKSFDKNHPVFVSVFEQLSKAEFKQANQENPQENETGNTATATINLGGKEIPYTLYEMKDGRWGFHL